MSTVTAPGTARSSEPSAAAVPGLRSEARGTSAGATREGAASKRRAGERAKLPSARDRLLDAADELFYEEGIHIVGIDRVIEKAGVAKASLYSTFGSKDELVRAYLNRRYEQRRTRIAEWVARYGTPRERLLGVFDALGDSIAQPGYHGCAFANATAESSRGSVAEQVTQEYRAWTRTLLTDLARETGAPDPATLGAQLHLLYDGVNWAARIDRDLDAAGRAQSAAAALLDAQLAAASA